MLLFCFVTVPEHGPDKRRNMTLVLPDNKGSVRVEFLFCVRSRLVRLGLTSSTYLKFRGPGLNWIN
jgi:hypothetical protein